MIKTENMNTRARKTVEFKHGNFTTVMTIIKELVRGAYGEVVLALDKRGKKFAVKKVKSKNRETYYVTQLKLLRILPIALLLPL